MLLFHSFYLHPNQLLSECFWKDGREGKLECLSGNRQYDSLWLSCFLEAKDTVTSSSWLWLIRCTHVLDHGAGLQVLRAAQLAGLLGTHHLAPAGLEIKHTCSSLHPSGTFCVQLDQLFYNKCRAPLLEDGNWWVPGLGKARICQGKLIGHYSRQSVAFANCIGYGTH